VAEDDRLVIETVNLTKVFKDFWRREKVRALDNLNLRIHRGEVFGLLGPNGSGKSTAVKLMLGLLFPTRGSVALLGRHPRSVDMKKRIGYMPEESYLYRFLNAEETLDFYGRLFDLNPTVRRNRTRRLLDMVGLTPHRRRPLSEYSKGMARRIGLAQALINDPELVLLDEPTTGLDPVGTREIKDLILELKRRGKTVLLCSHLLADVEDVCDRIAILYGGKVRAEGSVDELLAKRSLTQILTDALDEETVAEVEQVLQRAGAKTVEVSTPQERLEAYFLRVIEEARRVQPVTAGASVGTAAAKFWEAEDIEPQRDVLGRLVTAGEEPAPAAPPTLAETEAAAAPAARKEEAIIPPREAPAPKEDVLEKLVSAPKEAPEAEEVVPKSPFEIAEEERRRRARSVLEQLTRGEPAGEAPTEAPPEDQEDRADEA